MTHRLVDPPTDHERDPGRDQTKDEAQSDEDQERAAQRGADDGIAHDGHGFPPGQPRLSVADQGILPKLVMAVVAAALTQTMGSEVSRGRFAGEVSLALGPDGDDVVSVDENPDPAFGQVFSLDGLHEVVEIEARREQEGRLAADYDRRRQDLEHRLMGGGTREHVADVRGICPENLLVRLGQERGDGNGCSERRTARQHRAAACIAQTDVDTLETPDLAHLRIEGGVVAGLKARRGGQSLQRGEDAVDLAVEADGHATG